jgi:gas vesicle protein
MQNRNYRNEVPEEMGWSSFLSGALVGGGIALLLAPQSGTELRGMLSNYASRAKENLLEKAEEIYDKGEEVVQDAGRSQGNLPNRDSRRAGQSIKEFV